MSKKNELHVAVIMDGNGRWAALQGKPRLLGHRAGAEALIKSVEECSDLGISILTVFAFAMANQSRDSSEKNGLWKLLRRFFGKEIQRLINGNVRVQAIGNLTGLPLDVQNVMNEAERKTQNNNGLLLQVALNYSGEDDEKRALVTVKHKIQQGIYSLEDLNQEMIRSEMDCAGVLKPHIIVRTGCVRDEETGFLRYNTSDFLTDESRQSIHIPLITLWPDFTPELLNQAIQAANLQGSLYGGQRPETIAAE